MSLKVDFKSGAISSDQRGNNSKFMSQLDIRLKNHHLYLYLYLYNPLVYNRWLLLSMFLYDPDLPLDMGLFSGSTLLQM